MDELQLNTEQTLQLAVFAFTQITANHDESMVMDVDTAYIEGLTDMYYVLTGDFDGINTIEDYIQNTVIPSV